METFAKLFARFLLFVFTVSTASSRRQNERLDHREAADYWSWLLGPKFSEQDRKAVNLRRGYSLNQVEFCRNFFFKRHFPIHKMFEHSCEMGLFRLALQPVL